MDQWMGLFYEPLGQCYLCEELMLLCWSDVLADVSSILLSYRLFCGICLCHMQNARMDCHGVWILVLV